MNLFRQDMVLEMVFEHHDGVVSNGTANECMHGPAKGLERGLFQPLNQKLSGHVQICFQVKSSSRAAFTSSSLRTGVVWGAFLTNSG